MSRDIRGRAEDLRPASVCDEDLTPLPLVSRFDSTNSSSRKDDRLATRIKLGLQDKLSLGNLDAQQKRRYRDSIRQTLPVEMKVPRASDGKSLTE